MLKRGRLIFDSEDYDDNEDNSDFEMSLDNLTAEVLRKRNLSGCWKAEVNNFGWRSLNGHKYFEADSMQKLLRNILPDCECHFRIYNYGKGFAINNAHHDSPCWAEWYYVLPISEGKYYKETGGC